MVDDLVKRLRDPDYKSANGNCFEGLLRDLCDEAADLIKKLEAALREIRKTYAADGNRLIHGDQSIMEIIDQVLEEKDE